MKLRLLPFLLALCLLAGCGQAVPSSGGEDTLTVLATTYPIYLFASTVVQGVEGVEVERLDTGSVSCLHDYTLSVSDMKKIEGADVIVMNGAGLEDFMDDALAASRAAVIDCSEGIGLLENLSHHHEEGDADHDHGHWDPHYWMSPNNAVIMVETLFSGLSALDPLHEQAYRDNAQAAAMLLAGLDGELRQLLQGEGSPEITGLITFHDGFQYFAQAYDLPLLAAIEEEAGSEASAKEIVEIAQLVREHGIPAVFTEVNGSDATAKAIARETGCQVVQLTMVMDGPDSSLSNYLNGLTSNAAAISRAFGGDEEVK